METEPTTAIPRTWKTDYQVYYSSCIKPLNESLFNKKKHRHAVTHKRNDHNVLTTRYQPWPKPNLEQRRLHAPHCPHNGPLMSSVLPTSVQSVTLRRQHTTHGVYIVQNGDADRSGRTKMSRRDKKHRHLAFGVALHVNNSRYDNSQ